MSTATLGNRHSVRTTSHRTLDRPGITSRAAIRAGGTHHEFRGLAVIDPRSGAPRPGRPGSHESTRSPGRAVRGHGQSAPRDGRPAPEHLVGNPRVGGTRCAQPVGPRTTTRTRAARRRSWALATVAGAILAFSVWTIAIVGGNYADSVTPSPVRTEVTHVRAGDSLSTIAQRVAPDLPRQSVIDQIIELNDMGSSGLRVGQPLLTPAYH